MQDYAQIKNQTLQTVNHKRVGAAKDSPAQLLKIVVNGSVKS
jgi:hypothetical protein